MRKNVELSELGLSNQALFRILSGKVNSQILSMRIENKNFPLRFLDYAQTYFEDANAPAFQSRNAMIDFGIDALKDYVRGTPEARREATHDINRMNAEKITASEVSMIRLRDIMMSIMLEQVKEIRNERPVTTEDMSNIIVDYSAQSGLDEEAQKSEKALFADVQR